MPVSVTLTKRQVVLIRVALIRRLDALKGRSDMEQSYNETRDMLCGVMGIHLEQALADEVA